MPITFQEAYDATNPADDDDARKESASRIMAGVAANEAYWNSRSDLEALRAQAEGHGVVVRGSDDPEGSPTAVGTGTGSPVIEGTATEESVTAPAEAPAPSPDNPTEAVAKLRAQLEGAGITPEA